MLPAGRTGISASSEPASDAEGGGGAPAAVEGPDPVAAVVPVPDEPPSSSSISCSGESVPVSSPTASKITTAMTPSAPPTPFPTSNAPFRYRPSGRSIRPVSGIPIAKSMHPRSRPGIAEAG